MFTDASILSTPSDRECEESLESTITDVSSIYNAKIRYKVDGMSQKKE